MDNFGELKRIANKNEDNSKILILEDFKAVIDSSRVKYG
jgi:hypothetical protein